MFSNEEKTTQLFGYLKESGYTFALWGAGKLGRFFEQVGSGRSVTMYL